MCDFSISPNEVYGFFMRRYIKKQILNGLKDLDKETKKVTLKLQIEILNEILYEMESEEK